MRYIKYQYQYYILKIIKIPLIKNKIIFFSQKNSSKSDKNSLTIKLLLILFKFN